MFQFLTGYITKEECCGTSNEYEEIITIMCECTFDKGYSWGKDSKEKDKEENKKYYMNFLAERKAALTV